MAAQGEPGDRDSGEVALLEAARQKVLGVASLVLGGLAPDEVPPGLRAIARFTPSRRQRLGAVALAAALDSDTAFRDRVAEAVATASPDLVTAVREGTPTAAADPLDVAVIAYLVRPPGWPDVLAAANRRWSDEHAAADTADELAALRAELGELRTRARTEPARLREATTQAAAAREAEAAELRRALRDRTRELRAAERAREDAQAEAADVRARLGREQVTFDAQLRRLRGRLAEAGQAAEAARRGTRTARDVDDARLWLLVDTIVQAAGGVRRELSLSPPTLRPADLVAGAVEDTAASGAGSDGRGVRDAAELDRVLALPHAHLVVDGYNVTKTGYDSLSLEQQRTRLLGALAPLAAQSGAEITVAFDGGSRPPALPPTPRGVRVLFSGADEIADDLIRRVVGAEPAGRAVVVVTSDQEIVRDTRREGAWTVPAQVLLARLA